MYDNVMDKQVFFSPQTIETLVLRRVREVGVEDDEDHGQNKVVARLTHASHQYWHACAFSLGL